MKSLTLLLVIPVVLGGTIHQVPNPYRWDASFTVEIPSLDDEHRGLFNALLKIERDNTAKNLQDALKKFSGHFATEENMFEQTMADDYVTRHKESHEDLIRRAESWNSPVPSSELKWAKSWLVQHIKNTDHQYIGLMPHNIPRPFEWDDSFDVFYKTMNDEHISLFDALRAVEHNLDGKNELEDLKFKLRAHFDDEQSYFCNSDSYNDCESHKDKHDSFYRKVYSIETPVSKAQVDFAKNWLVQHIKNSDFSYKHKLNAYRHDIPEPYYWESSFQVFYKQMDDEHKGLFDAIRDSTENPEDASRYEHLKKVLAEHFRNEEREFKKIQSHDEYVSDHIYKHKSFLKQVNSGSVPLDCSFIEYAQNWLVQHIKNTDFAYRGKLLHTVPEPFQWDESFMVFYKSLDDQHKGLFDCVKDCAENPSSQEKYDTCKSLLRRHFDDEELEFCKPSGYDCYGHYLKHFNFLTKLQSAHLPLAESIIDFAKNWLTQHIKNTDHAYKGKLMMRRHFTIPEPYAWDDTFSVDIEEMDSEHQGLFEAVQRLESSPGDKSAWDATVKVFNEHFQTEEDLFSEILDNEHDIADHKHRHRGLMRTITGATIPVSKEMLDFVKNWLVQHIKNTDFDYRGKMPKVHPIPDPFQWDSSFAVFYADLDEEHKELFNCARNIANNKNDASLLNICTKVFADHFTHEEGHFLQSGTYPAEEAYQHINNHNAFLATMKDLDTPVPDYWLSYAMNWLTQHIKNSDFRYKNKMPFDVPEPFAWDESFEVFYTRLDEEHKELFDVVRMLGEDPNDVDILNFNRDVFHNHFEYEEDQFRECGESCGADDHKKKHDTFFKTLTWVTTPVSKEYLEFAKNWLTQHIKNTDFLYKSRLPTQHTVPRPYVWNDEFAVFYKNLDEEHKGLFDGIRAVEEIPTSRRNVNHLKTILRNHFTNEEQEFCNSPNMDWDYCKDHKRKHVQFSEKLAGMEAPVSNGDIAFAQNWLVQHIKNTDFAYKGKLSHPVPEPFAWDSSFAVNYEDLDSQHQGIFSALFDLTQSPGNKGTLESMKTLIKDHFDHEEGRFCSVQGFNCVDHKMKHYKFITRLMDLDVPVNCDTIQWAKNWFSQHVKNTDKQYMKRL